MVDINYAVITMNKNGVDELISTLQTNGKSGDIGDIIEWLEANRCRYGDFLEDWRPFGGDTIKKIIKSSGEYVSETVQIEKYLENYPTTINLSRIRVVFVDIFSMYLKKYSDLAIRSDQAFSSAENNSCCFLLDCNLPDNVQKELERLYAESWPLVSEEYNNGCLHRMAARIDDLKNFKNYLIKEAYKDLPNPKMLAYLTEIILKENGKSYGDKQRPSF